MGGAGGWAGQRERGGEWLLNWWLRLGKAQRVLGVRVGGGVTTMVSGSLLCCVFKLGKQRPPLLLPPRSLSPRPGARAPAWTVILFSIVSSSARSRGRSLERSFAFAPLVIRTTLGPPSAPRFIGLVSNDLRPLSLQTRSVRVWVTSEFRADPGTLRHAGPQAVTDHIKPVRSPQGGP